MNKDEFREALNLGQAAQIGCVVRDLAKTIENYEQVIGIGPFMSFDFTPEKGFVKDRHPDIHLKIGIAELTPDLSLELIEVVSGEPYHKDHLEKLGEGVQHIGFVTGEYDAVLKRADKLGVDVLMWAETDVDGMGHVRGAYLDTLELIGVLVEIVEIIPPE